MGYVTANPVLANSHIYAKHNFRFLSSGFGKIQQWRIDWNIQTKKLLRRGVCVTLYNLYKALYNLYMILRLP